MEKIKISIQRFCRWSHGGGYIQCGYSNGDGVAFRHPDFNTWFGVPWTAITDSFCGLDGKVIHRIDDRRCVVKHQRTRRNALEQMEEGK